MTKTRLPHAADPRYSAAAINTPGLRYLSMVVAERGFDTALLCRGLGFRIEELEQPSFRVSYRQGSVMIRRALALVDDMALGIAVGQRQTIVSWGLVGFAMLSCATVGDAMDLGLGFQREAGALVTITLERRDGRTAVVADPIFDDPDIEIYLMDELFSSFVTALRQMVGPQFAPERIELVHQAPPHAALYEAIFRCPVRFGASRNRYIIDAHWTRFPLPTYDAIAAKAVQGLIEQSLRHEREKVDLCTTIERAIRDKLTQRLPTLRDIAATQNLSERTLRRRLADAGFSYDAILESVRQSRALELLRHSRQTIEEVAHEAGFSDVRAFRRAFKRWTGVPPTEVRG